MAATADQLLRGHIREDLEALLGKVFHDLFGGPTDGKAFTGLHALLDLGTVE